MSAKRRFITKADLIYLATRTTVLALVGAILFLTPAGSMLKAYADSTIFNPDVLNPFDGHWTVSNDFAYPQFENPGEHPVGEWAPRVELTVTNTGITVGGFRIARHAKNAYQGSEAADAATLVRIKQDGRVVVPAMPLDELAEVFVDADEDGFAVGETTTFVLEAKVTGLLATTASHSDLTVPGIFATAVKPFQRGMDHYEPVNEGPDPRKYFPNLGGHDTGL